MWNLFVDWKKKAKKGLTIDTEMQ